MSAGVCQRQCVLAVSACILLSLGFYAGQHKTSFPTVETVHWVSLARNDARSTHAGKDNERSRTGQNSMKNFTRQTYASHSHSREGFNATSTAKASSDRNVVWLYSFVPTDYEAPSLLPHFLRHYSEMGIPSSHIFIDLQHDPSLPDKGFLKAQHMFTTGDIHTRTFLQPYSPESQDQLMISGLQAIPMGMEDWIVVTDVDEFFTFGEDGVYRVIERMNAESASFALGEMLDHVAPEGKLNHVHDTTDIWTQFPVVCPIISKVGKGLPAKVTITKAYLRTGAAHHHVVEPHLAYAYFSDDCTGFACELVMKRYKQRTLKDLYQLTPYAQHSERYVLSGTTSSTGWRAKQFSVWTKIHHFKWHAAILDNLFDRVSRDSGNCVLNVNEDDCQPKFQFWKERARQLDLFNRTRSIDVTSMDCKEGVDTFWDWT